MKQNESNDEAAPKEEEESTSPKIHAVYIVSDGTGETATKVLKAALRQFTTPYLPRTFAPLASSADLEAMFRLARTRGAVVFSTLVQADLRSEAVRLAAEHGVPHVDLLGPALAMLEARFEERPAGLRGILHTTDAHYFQRVEAVEFTVRCDDGRSPELIGEADIVLVGVSRSSKTPLSTFLAHKGYKVANVPLYLDGTPPKQLWHIDQRRVFALRIEPDTLRNIRQNRLRAMRMPPTTNYGDKHYILAELESADSLFRANPTWPVLDVTAKAVEETAGQILSHLEERGLTVPRGEVSQL